MLQLLNFSVGETVLIDVNRKFRRDLRGEVELTGRQHAYGFNEFMAQCAFRKIAARALIACNAMTSPR